MTWLWALQPLYQTRDWDVFFLAPVGAYPWLGGWLAGWLVGWRSLKMYGVPNSPNPLPREGRIWMDQNGNTKRSKGRLCATEPNVNCKKKECLAPISNKGGPSVICDFCWKQKTKHKRNFVPLLCQKPARTDFCFASKRLPLPPPQKKKNKEHKRKKR